MAAVQTSESNEREEDFSYTDFLEDAELRQYEYRVDVKVKDEETYEAVEGKSVLASNILICIDPGHYEGKNAVDPEGVAYTEGDFTLELALELRKLLKEDYGITACLTRDSGTINMGGGLLKQPGTICYRTDWNGDYYGVLRGAASVGVSGMIIEHGFHTVPVMRSLAAQGTLKVQWARADAEGIAEGFGLLKAMEE